MANLNGPSANVVSQRIMQPMIDRGEVARKCDFNDLVYRYNIVRPGLGVYFPGAVQHDGSITDRWGFPIEFGQIWISRDEWPKAQAVGWRAIMGTARQVCVERRDSRG